MQASAFVLGKPLFQIVGMASVVGTVCALQDVDPETHTMVYIVILEHAVRSSTGSDRTAKDYSGRICGNRITSLIDGLSVSSITRRSMPMPAPAVGGRPYSMARI